MRAGFFLIAMLVSAALYCQSPGYTDADTASEALGMMKSSIEIARVMRERCIGRFPDMQEEIDSGLNQWRAAEAGILAKVEVYWPIVLKNEPKLAELASRIEKVVSTNLDMISRMQGPEGRTGADVAKAYCRKHFTDLASGVWRSRTPRVYEFIERAPEVRAPERP